MELKEKRKQFAIGFIILYLISISLIYHAVFILDGTRVSHKYSAPIPENPSEEIVYFEYEPLMTAPDRGNKVAFLFAGYQTPVEMMSPIMMELTKTGYHVIMGDFRGEGRSGGELSMDWTKLIKDFDIMYNDVKSRHSDWNMTHVTVVGHSMAGFGVLLFGNQREYVWNTVAIAPGSYPEYVNSTDPKNMMIINGEFDQAIPNDSTINLFRKAVPNGEPGIFYGNPKNGTAKQYLIQNMGRHETECYNDFVLSHAMTFIEVGYGYLEKGDMYLAKQERRMNNTLFGTMVGLVSIIFMVLGMETFQVSKKSNEDQIQYKLIERYRKIYSHWRKEISSKIKDLNLKKRVEKLTGLKIEQKAKKEKSKTTLNNTELSSAKEEMKKQSDQGTSDKQKEKKTNRQSPKSDDEKEPSLKVSLSEKKFSYKKFLQRWFTYLPHGILISAILFLIVLFSMKNLYVHIQVILMGYSGFISLFMMGSLYKSVYGERLKITQLLGYYWLKLKQDLSLLDILKGCVYTVVTMSILILGIGNIYLFPFPLNHRAYQGFFYFPFFFLMYLFQAPVLLHYLTDNLSQKYKGPLTMNIQSNPLLKSLFTTLVSKFGLIYLVGFGLIFFDNYMISILFLITLVDLLVSFLMILNYYYNKSYIAVIIFGALLATFVYLAFSGYHNGVEALFGENSLAKWIV